jgi:hypothetical protein
MVQSEPGSQKFLAVYLNDHLMGSSAGVDGFRRVATRHSDPETRDTLSRLADEVGKDRTELLRLMHRLGIRPLAHSVIRGRLVEKVARLKPNGKVLGRSLLDDLLELEALSLGVEGKLAGWHALNQIAHDNPRIDKSSLERLIARAESQRHQLEELRRRNAASTLGGSDG